MLPSKVDRLKRSVYFKGSIFSRRLIIKLKMKKRTFFCIVKYQTTTTIERGPQMKDIISTLTMKELEKITYRALQKSFSQVIEKTLKELDRSDNSISKK